MHRLVLDIGTCVTVLVCGCVCEASRGCEGIQCSTRTNGSATPAGCCDKKLSTFGEQALWLARKLSGLLILLALFALGYFVQRLVCPRHRRRGRATQEPDSLLSAHTTASRDTLLESYGYDECGVQGFTSPVLQPPAYDEIKDLPTYEESVRAAGMQQPGGSVRPVAAHREKPEAARIFRNSV
ncbi:uncharacterized membrane protein C3orf80 homolog [Trichomycterus rosablanca]|uniref:uncharacterized membrane protein C3orf80 homolog n=1 Tax=Trichomycterus rosablanca TaxID=2290929 RepID=UPI002F360CF4